MACPADASIHPGLPDGLLGAALGDSPCTGRVLESDCGGHEGTIIPVGEGEGSAHRCGAATRARSSQTCVAAPVMWCAKQCWKIPETLWPQWVVNWPSDVSRGCVMPKGRREGGKGKDENMIGKERP